MENYRNLFQSYIWAQGKIDKLTAERTKYRHAHPGHRASSTFYENVGEVHDTVEADFTRYCEKKYGYDLASLRKQSEDTLSALIESTKVEFAEKNPQEIWVDECIVRGHLVKGNINRLFSGSVFSLARRKYYLENIRNTSTPPTPRELESQFLAACN